MRIALFLLLVGLLPQQKPASEFEITAAELAGRRERLCERLKDAWGVLDTGPLKDMKEDVDFNTPLYDFRYFTNYHDDTGVLVFSGPDKRTWLFTNNPKAGAKTGIGTKDVLPRAQLGPKCAQLLAKATRVLTKLRGDSKKIIESVTPRGATTGTLAGEISSMRLIKTEHEVKLIKKASDATCKAHLAAMKTLKPGMNEALIQKTIEDTFRKEGCDGLAFPSICAAGKNGTTLHYFANKDPIPPGTLMVCDIGAAIFNYATDITRTLPTSGKYAGKQKEAYEAVLAAQKAAEAILKPGATFGSLHSAAAKVFEDRGLTDWSYAQSTANGPRHGLSHWVGLAVHDSGGNVPFEEGMVLTIEPGYYNVREGYGIRIEDMYLVTKDGFERLSSSAPREVEEIEKAMAGK